MELETDQPIDGAGVLAVYSAEVPSVAGWHGRNLGYQAVLTDEEGNFEVPAKIFYTFKPLGKFKPEAWITIYKWGYGHFPGSFPKPRRLMRDKMGKSEPELENLKIPPEQRVIYWLPNLKTAEEIRDHNSSFFSTISRKLGYPPKGMHDGLFRPPKYSGWDGPLKEQYDEYNKALSKDR